MKNKRILAIDYGLVRVGFAISDPTQTIATSMGVLKISEGLEASTQAVIDYIEKTCKERNFVIETIVIGYPLHLDGKMSHMTARVQAFHDLLQTKTEISLVLFDERLTTVQAERMLIQEANISRKKRKLVIDAISAMVSLQNYLDRKKTYG